MSSPTTSFVAAEGEELEEDEIIREAVGIVDEIARRRKADREPS